MIRYCSYACMGSSFALSEPNLFMSRLENLFILNENVNPYCQYIEVFYRFLDDYFCIYNDDVMQLKICL